jgi:hypothetical protein
VLSPSGRYLLATERRTWVLKILDLRTHTERPLARDVSYASWSADEEFAYFNQFDGASPAMYRVRATNGVQETVFKLEEFEAAGSWRFWSTVAPDGSELLMRDTGAADLFAIDSRAR